MLFVISCNNVQNKGHPFSEDKVYRNKVLFVTSLCSTTCVASYNTFSTRLVF